MPIIKKVIDKLIKNIKDLVNSNLYKWKIITGIKNIAAVPLLKVNIEKNIEKVLVNNIYINDLLEEK